MARPEYPLEALRQLRDDRAEEQAEQLARQVAVSQGAETRLRERERARREHAERTAQSLHEERARLSAGGVMGVDLLRSADFQAASRAQAELLERAESEARQGVAEARAEEARLRAVFAEREAEAKLVRNHEASFQARQQELAQKSEEEAALEQWNARRR